MLVILVSIVIHFQLYSYLLVSGALKAAAPVGTLIGQIIFGYAADHIGRKRMCASLLYSFIGDLTECCTRTDGIELIIIIIGTFGQTLAANSDVGTVNIYAALIVWRLIVSPPYPSRSPMRRNTNIPLQMGLGIGGDYPLSAVITSEFASTHIRGRLMTAVFANQGWGQFGK